MECLRLFDVSRETFHWVPLVSRATSPVSRVGCPFRLQPGGDRELGQRTELRAPFARFQCARTDLSARVRVWL